MTDIQPAFKGIFILLNAKSDRSEISEKSVVKKRKDANKLLSLKYLRKGKSLVECDVAGQVGKGMVHYPSFMFLQFLSFLFNFFIYLSMFSYCVPVKKTP